MAKKLFISQPFHGKTEDEIMRDRDVILRRINKTYPDDYEAIDQYHQSWPVELNGVQRRLYFLSNDIRMMYEADLIVFSHDWSTAAGCKIEHYIAELYHLPFVEL